jgi:hypothetical protein
MSSSYVASIPGYITTDMLSLLMSRILGACLSNDNPPEITKYVVKTIFNCANYNKEVSDLDNFEGIDLTGFQYVYNSKGKSATSGVFCYQILVENYKKENVFVLGSIYDNDLSDGWHCSQGVGDKKIHGSSTSDNILLMAKVLDVISGKMLLVDENLFNNQQINEYVVAKESAIFKPHLVEGKENKLLLFYNVLRELEIIKSNDNEKIHNKMKQLEKRGYRIHQSPHDWNYFNSYREEEEILLKMPQNVKRNAHRGYKV